MMSLDRTFTGILHIVVLAISGILMLNGDHATATALQQGLPWSTCSSGNNKLFNLVCLDGLIHLTSAQVQERYHYRRFTWKTCSPSREFVRNAMGTTSLTRPANDNEFEPNTCECKKCKKCIRYIYQCAKSLETINMCKSNTNNQTPLHEGYIAVETKLSAGDRYSCMVSSDTNWFKLTLLSLRLGISTMLHINILETEYGTNKYMYPRRRNITHSLFHFPVDQAERQDGVTVYWYLKKVELTLTGTGDSSVFINFHGATYTGKVDVRCNSPTTSTTSFTTTSTATSSTASQTTPTSTVILTTPTHTSEQASSLPDVDSTSNSFPPHTTTTSHFIKAEQAREDNSDKQAAVIGGSAGGAVLFLVAIVLLIVLLLKRKGKLSRWKEKNAESALQSATALDNLGAYECAPVSTHRTDRRSSSHHQYEMTDLAQPRARNDVGVDNNVYEDTYSKQYIEPRGEDQQVYESADYAGYDYAAVPPSKQRSITASALSRSTAEASQPASTEAGAPSGVLTESNDLYDGEAQMQVQQNDLYEGDRSMTVQQNDLYEGCEQMPLDESSKHVPASLDVQQNDLYGSD